MGARPEPPREIADAARAWIAPLKAALGADYVAAYLTGSVLAPGFDVRRSRVNVLIVARELDPATLDSTRAALPDSPKSPGFDLLLLTRTQVEDSLDTFPIELLELREQNLRLDGDDVLGPIDVPREFLRLQCEHELRAKHIQLRQAWLHSSRKAEALQDVLRGTASSFSTLFRTLLRLRGQAVPADRADMIRRIASEFGLDAASLLPAFEVRSSDRRYKASEIEPIYRAFLAEIGRLVVAIDQLRVS